MIWDTVFFGSGLVLFLLWLMFLDAFCEWGKDVRGRPAGEGKS